MATEPFGRLGLGDGGGRARAGPGVALPAHYPWHLDTVGHLGLIYADTVLFCVGAALALAGLQRVRSPA